MRGFDDYNPHVFYPDDTQDGDNIATLDYNSSSKKGKESGVSQRKRREERRKKQQQKQTADPLVVSGIRNFFSSRTTYIITGIILAGFAAYFIISFVSYLGSCLKDQSVIYNNAVGSIPEVSNKGGEGGARLSEFLINGGFGLGAFVIIIWLTCVSLNLLIGKPRFKFVNFTIKCLIAFIALSLIIGLATIGSNTSINWGGYHGRYVNQWIIGFLGWGGAAILCLVMICIFVTISMRDIIKWIVAKKRLLDEKRRAILEERARKKRHEDELQEMKLREEKEFKGDHDSSEKSEEDKEDINLTFYSKKDEPDGENDPGSKVNPYEYESLEPLSNAESGDAEPKDEAKIEERGAVVKLEEETDDTPMVVNVNQIAQNDQLPRPSRHSLYKFPPLDLLKDGVQTISVNAEEQQENKEKIRKTLLDFGIPIVGIEATVGPTVTLYEIKPDKGQRVAKIKSLVDDISLSLSAIGVRIIAPIPGKGTVGIEVANKKAQKVAMKTLLQSKKYMETKALLPLALGATISNEVYIADLASIPHLLVAGATGQGKSVGLNVIISSLLFKKRPDELKFVLFDPKMVEFNLYSVIEKQYLARLPDEEEAIITDMNKVVPTLNSLCIEMDDRYRLLKDAEVRKVEEYNDLIKKNSLDKDKGHRYLPYIVVIVDEFSDLIMQAGREVEMPIARLAQKARAVGIHVIIATQRPSTAVITGNIKTNFPGRMAFKVSSSIDSKVILDATGAQQLIGKGDMLILNSSEMVRVQCAFIDTPEIKALCEHISQQPFPEDSPYMLPVPPQKTEGGVGESYQEEDRDVLYDEIRQYVITSGTASTSNIQRKYKLGYTRAGRIMDQLEADGVVGPNQGGKPREVLISN